jgi:hypothetical protein
MPGGGPAPGTAPLEPTLADSIALLRLVLGLLGHEAAPAAPFFVWSAAALVYLRPRAEILAA